MQDFIAELIKSPHGVEKSTPIKRAEVLCGYGTVETALYYVNSGALCAFHLNDGEEQVIRLGYKASIINALPSYFTGKPSMLEIRAIRASNITRIHKSVIEAYVQSSVEHGKAYQKLLEQLQVEQTERELDILTKSPQERYARVYQRSPQLFQEIPAKYIASYLRMTPETLSRVQNLDSNQGKS